MKRKIIIFSLLILALTIFGYFLSDLFTVESITQKRETIISFVDSNFFLSIFIYVLIYLLIVISSLPFSALMTVLAGFLFGVIQGSIVSMISAVIGASASLYIFKHFLGNQFQKYYSSRLIKFNQNFDKYGSRYLIIIHLFMVVPFFVINALTAMTNISYFTFIWTTVVGMLPSTILYTYAGYQLRIANSTGEIFSWKVIIAFSFMIILSFASIIFQNYKEKKKNNNL